MVHEFYFALFDSPAFKDNVLKFPKTSVLAIIQLAQLKGFVTLDDLVIFGYKRHSALSLMTLLTALGFKQSGIGWSFTFSSDYSYDQFIDCCILLNKDTTYWLNESIEDIALELRAFGFKSNFSKQGITNFKKFITNKQKFIHFLAYPHILTYPEMRDDYHQTRTADETPVPTLTRGVVYEDLLDAAVFNTMERVSEEIDIEAAIEAEGHPMSRDEYRHYAMRRKIESRTVHLPILVYKGTLPVPLRIVNTEVIPAFSLDKCHRYIEKLGSETITIDPLSESLVGSCYVVADFIYANWFSQQEVSELPGAFMTDFTRKFGRTFEFDLEEVASIISKIDTFIKFLPEPHKFHNYEQALLRSMCLYHPFIVQHETHDDDEFSLLAFASGLVSEEWSTGSLAYTFIIHSFMTDNYVSFNSKGAFPLVTSELIFRSGCRNRSHTNCLCLRRFWRAQQESSLPKISLDE